MPELRAAVYSSSELKEDREKANALGAVAYLPKSEAVSVTAFVRNWEADGSGAHRCCESLTCPSAGTTNWGMHPSLPFHPIVVLLLEAIPNALALRTFRGRIRFQS